LNPWRTNGLIRVEIAGVEMAEGKLYLFVAIDRTSKFAFVELHQKAGKMAAAAFPRNLIAAVPGRLQIALTPLSRFAGIQSPATEPHDQGRDLETLQLRRPRPAQKSHGQLSAISAHGTV
jgi:hypothetical protein